MFHNIEPVGLPLTSEDKADLISFLKTLTDERFLTDEQFSSPFK
jgi:cytochrome c peroxidase